ncbi:MAG: AI-2E family transporter [Persicimonas sp.]
MSEITGDTPGDTPADRSQAEGAGPILFPRLSPDEYKASLYRYLYILMRLVFLALILAGIWYASTALGALLFPLVASATIAYLLDPIIKRFEERGASRTVAVAICVLSVTLLVGLVGLFMVPTIVEEIGALIGQLPDFVRTVQTEWVPWIEQKLDTELPADVRQGVERYGEQISASLPYMAQQAGQWALGAVSTTGHVLLTLFNMILIPLFTFYFLSRLDRFKTEVVRWLPIRRREYTLKLLSRMDDAVGNWFRGQVQVAVIIGLLFSVGLALVFGLAGIDPKLGIAIGIISGLLNIVPYFGTIVAIILTALVVLLNWAGWLAVLGVVAVFLIINALESYVLTPRIVGTKVGLSPIAVIILLLIGGELAGIWGILLIMPIAGAIKVIMPDLLAIYRETAFYQGQMASEDGE